MADREFKGIWIPREVWLDERLNALEKIILAEIDSLDNSEDGCWASNEYIAEFCQCSSWKVASSISKLVKLGFLKVVSFDGRRRKIKSCLTFFKMQTFENQKADTGKSKEINTNKEYKKESISRQRADADYPQDFNDFWSLYPRKVAKQTAFKSWARLKANDALQQKILSDVQRRIDGEWRGKDVQYIPHPTTYLNQRRWEDETSQPEPEAHDPTVEEVMRMALDGSMPEGFKPCGGW